jgi:VIT1/CCC1 family predicted Fe2+/Mn2+ transporter
MDSGMTHQESRQAEQPAYVGQVFGAGVVLLLWAAVLYVSGLSRAVGVVVAAVGVATLLGAFVARRRRAWPSRAWLIAVAVLLLALVAYGVALLIDSANYPPIAV